MKYILLIFLLFCFPALSAPIQITSGWDDNANQTIQMKISPADNLKMALFKRNGYTYFVFQTAQELQFDETVLQNLPLARLKHPSALILRGVLAPNMTPEFFVLNHILYLKMHTENEIPESSLKAKWLLNGALLELNDADLIEFNDPNTLENFLVFVTPYSPLFMKEKYDTPEMTFLPTFQGVAIYPKTSAFHVQKNEDGFVIYPQNKKALTIPQNDTDDFEKIDWNGYMDLSAQNNEIQNLKTFILYVSDDRKEQLHQEMAQIYLSQVLADQALEILQNMPDGEIKTDLIFLSYILKNNSAAALKEWDKIKRPSTALKLWKNIIDDDLLLSADKFEKVNLSPAMAFVFWKNLAQKAADENNPALLEKAVDELEKLNLNDYQKQTLIYFKGQIAEKENDMEKAIEIYAMADKLPLTQYSGQIMFAKVMAQIEIEKISNEEAILQLEKMRHLLASTDLEIPLLQMLSALYNENQDVVHALHTERQMLSITQDDAILKRMQRHFEQFLMTNQMPIKRVALYNEFKELMPTGVKAISIKQQLVNDFIALDLLNNAYDLAMELAQTTTDKTQQQSAVYAYLIATLLENTEKQSAAQEYLSEDWKKQPLPDNLPEILKWAYKKKM